VPPVQDSPEDTAIELVHLTIPEATFRLIDDHYVGDNGIAHFYFRQTANDLDVDNADFKVNIDRNGNVLSFGHSFQEGDAPSSLQKRDIVEPLHAFKSAVKALDLPVNVDSATAE
jgi:extracellular elastinolytic metalloproteinase